MNDYNLQIKYLVDHKYFFNKLKLILKLYHQHISQQIKK